MTRAPSAKAIAQAFDVSPRVANVVRDVLKGKIAPAFVSMQASELVRRSCHPHADYYLKLTAVNELIGGHGVEYTPKGKGRRSPAFDYINMGDTYAVTILRMSPNNYRLRCWGDIVERGNYE